MWMGGVTRPCVQQQLLQGHSLSAGLTVASVIDAGRHMRRLLHVPLWQQGGGRCLLHLLAHLLHRPSALIRAHVGKGTEEPMLALPMHLNTKYARGCQKITPCLVHTCVAASKAVVAAVALPAPVICVRPVRRVVVRAVPASRSSSSCRPAASLASRACRAARCTTVISQSSRMLLHG
jgi:hypothetical protein